MSPTCSRVPYVSVCSACYLKDQDVAKRVAGPWILASPATLLCTCHSPLTRQILGLWVEAGPTFSFSDTRKEKERRRGGRAELVAFLTWHLPPANLVC